MKIPTQVQDIFSQITSLQQFPQFLGAYIFGSFADGSFGLDSDIDICIHVEDSHACENLSHPIINDKKLDISYNSYQKIEDMNRVFKDRPPMIKNSIILFDKTGKLTLLKEKLAKVVREYPKAEEINFYKFMIYHADDKAKRNLDKDPDSSVLAMNINLNDLLKYHYHLNQRWWLSNKKLLPDLRTWDSNLSQLISKFLNQSSISEKFNYWSKIIDHILNPIGGRQPISENICQCQNCQQNLKLLKN